MPSHHQRGKRAAVASGPFVRVAVSALDGTSVRPCRDDHATVLRMPGCVLLTDTRHSTKKCASKLSLDLKYGIVLFIGSMKGLQ